LLSVFAAILAAWLTLDIVHPPGQDVRRIDQVLLILVVALVTFVASRLAGAAMHGYARANPAMFSSASLFASIARATIVVVGVLIALGSVGISITPLLTALGVGGLAVGLALQDTLANLFAGIQLLAARLFRPGDFVRLESGQEGTITDTTWRSTVIRDGAGALIVVPNTKLSSSMVTNMTIEGLRLAVPFAVANRAKLDEVSSLVADTTRTYLHENDIGLEEEPYVIFGTPGDATIPCTLCLHLARGNPPFSVRSGVMRRDACATPWIVTASSRSHPRNNAYTCEPAKSAAACSSATALTCPASMRAISA
jgi:small-conductance mechanosensitive channel